MTGPAARPPRRPLRLYDALAETIVGAPDPADGTELAYKTARALVDGGRGRSQDADLVRRLVTLVENEGLETIADLWSHAPAVSLPGALWRLYLIREWARRDPHLVVRAYRAGTGSAEVARAIAGIADPPSPEDVLESADRILAGVFDGDLDVALDRAASFVRVIAAGMVIGAEDDTESPRATRQVRRAALLMRTSDELEQAARLARAGTLE